jgi:transposase
MVLPTEIIPTGRHYLSQEERDAVVREFYLEGASKNSLVKKYNSSYSAILRIIRKFAAENDKSALLMKNRPTNSQEEEIKALQGEVLELKRKLYDETMRADFFETMVDVAEETFNIEIRKKAGTGQSKGCTEKKDTE